MHHEPGSYFCVSPYLEKSVVGPGLARQIRDLHQLFQRALAGETVWSPTGPPRVRR
ncbi:MAG: hypothetical protein ACNA8R_14745 [Nitriliruptoraceae bacterium]